MLGKNLRQKVRKNVFYINTNVVTKKWGVKNARNNFSINRRIVRTKNVGKKIVVIKCEKRFLYSHECREQKIVGKKRAKHFSINARIVREIYFAKKNCGKKVRKNVLHIHTNVVTKMYWLINARNNFYKNAGIVRAKNGKKSSETSAKKVFYNHTNIVTKK